MSHVLLPVLYSSKVSPQTRRVLEDRLEVPPENPSFFTPSESELLKHLAHAILPLDQAGTGVALTHRIDQRLHLGEGSGWRYASLPPGPEAYRLALRFIAQELPGAGVRGLLEHMQQQELDTPDFPISRWLEGFKFELVQAWLAHPRTMQLLQYAGFADEDLQPQTPAGAR